MATSLELIVTELNARNAQSHPASDLTVTYIRDDATTGSAVGKLAGTSSGSLATAGTTTIRYHRVDLADVFQTLPSPISIPAGSSVSAILSSLKQNYGIALSNQDVVDVPISWSNGAAQITLTASANSLGFKGAVTVSAVTQTVQLANVYPNLEVTVTDVPITPTALLAALNAVNHVNVPASAVTMSVVGTSASVGATTAKNTVARLTAVNGAGYAGTVDFYYDRKAMTWLADFASLSVDNDAVTGWNLVPYIVAIKGNIVTTADLVNSTIDYSVLPSYYDITASATSWTYTGSAHVDIQRRSDYQQKVTVNITATDTAYTTQKLIDAITPQVTKISPTDITINIAENVIIVGASSTTPTLVLGKYAGLTDVKYFINNHGSIYGRGGNGGPTNTGTATAGLPGGDAINITDATIEVHIDNQGRIMGGGGGGAYENNTSVIGYGGGGAPYGVSSAGATGTATQTSYTAGTSATNYPLNSNGGRGGDVGQDGGAGNLILTSNFSVQHTTPGGKAGAVVSGQTALLTWVNKGLRLPFQPDDLLPTGVTAASIQRTYPDPQSAKMLTMYLGSITAGTTSLSAANLCAAVGLTAGTAGSNTTLYLCYIDGKFVLMPTLPMRFSISYQQLYALGLIDGDGTTGKNPPNGATLVTQRKLIAYNGQNWSVRLMGGANNDPVAAGTTHVGTATTDTVNSEWNRLFYNLAAEVFSGQPANKWAAATDAQLNVAYNSTNNGYTLTKERHNFDGTDRRVTRGGGDSATDTAGIGIKRIGSAPVATATYQWRPLLELVG